MSLISYQIFDTVATKKSLARAAEELKLTPSAISHSLMKLESEFGFPLMVRDRSGVTLTPNGEQVLSSIRNILALEKTLRGKINMLNGLEKGTVKLGTFNSVCCSWLPAILAEFNHKYPGIDVHIQQSGYADIENGLLSAKLDLGFVSLPVAGNLAVTPLLRDRLLCITPTTFQPANPDFVTIDDIRDQQFILQREGYNHDTKLFIGNHNLTISRHHDICDDSSIIALVESGLGVSIIPELVLRKLQGTINIYPIENEPCRTIAIATQKEQFLTPATLALRQEIAAYAQKLTGGQEAAGRSA